MRVHINAYKCKHIHYTFMSTSFVVRPVLTACSLKSLQITLRKEDKYLRPAKEILQIAVEEVMVVIVVVVKLAVVLLAARQWWCWRRW